MLGGVIVVLFGGVSFVASKYQIVPGEDRALLIALAEAVFGKSGAGAVFYYTLTAITFIMLILAANTSFSGFPTLISVVAGDGYAPRQLRLRGSRLSYDNGIIVLSVCAAALIVVMRADVSKLIGLYAIGVFLSFTLAQFGLAKKLCAEKPPKWIPRMLTVGFGGAVTGCVVGIIAVTKFKTGVWFVIVAIPVMVFCMIKIRRHYNSIGKQLRLTDEDFKNPNLVHTHYRHRVIVPISGVNRSSVRALRYATTVCDDVQVFSVAIDHEEEAVLQERFAKLDCGLPLTVYYSAYREVLEPLIEFVNSAEYGLEESDIVTIVLPQFMVGQRWQHILHNHTRRKIERALIRHEHIVVATIPLQLSKKE